MTPQKIPGHHRDVKTDRAGPLDDDCIPRCDLGIPTGEVGHRRRFNARQSRQIVRVFHQIGDLVGDGNRNVDQLGEETVLLKSDEA